MNPPTPLFASLLLAWLRSEDSSLIPAMRAAYEPELSFGSNEDNVRWAVQHWLGYYSPISLQGLGVLLAVDNAFNTRYGLVEPNAPALLHGAKRRIVAYMEYFTKVTIAEGGT